jgi:PAS domain S-box-containing protein
MSGDQPASPVSIDDLNAGHASAAGMDDAPFGVAIVDDQLRVVYANVALRRLLGEDPDGRRLFELDGDSAKAVEAVRRAASGGLITELEVRREDAHQLVTAFPARDGDGNVTGAVVTFRDITAWVEDRGRAERLQRVSAELSGAPRIASVAEVVLGQGRQALGASAGVIALLSADGRTFEIAAAEGFDENIRRDWREFSADLETPMGDAVRRRQPLFIDRPEQRATLYPALALPGSTTSATVPLIADERVLGALTFRFDGEQPIEPNVRSFVIALGSQCAQAIDRARLYEAEKAARGRAERLADISVRLAAASEPSAVTEITAEAGVRVLGAAAASVVLVAGDQLEMVSSRGHAEDALERWQRSDRDHPSPIADCIRTGRAIFLDSRAEALGRYADLSHAVDEHRAWAALPLIAHGRALGALGLSFTSPAKLADSQRTGITTLAAQCAQALERAMLSSDIAVANQRLEAALLAGNMAWWEWDETSNRVVWSENLERIYGLDPGTFGGTYEAFLELVHPHDRQAMRERAAQGLRGEGHEFEHRIVTPDGRTRWLDGRSRALRRSDGSVLGLAGIAIDITKRKLVELALRESDARFRGLFETGVLGVSGGCGLAVDEANDALLELIGYTRDDLGDRLLTLDRLIVGEQGAPIGEQEWHRLLENGWLAPHEREFRRMDGSTVPVLFAAAVIDEASRRWIGYLLDQTERKRDEAALMFLAEASDLLSQSLDYQETLQRLAELVVPRLADWCSVAAVGDDGSIHNVAVAHSDPEKVALVRELERQYPTDPEATTGEAAVIRTGRTEFLPSISDELLVAAAPDETVLGILRDLGLRSVITAPLTARGRTFGAISLVIAESGRSYTVADVELLEDLAHRAALAIDNARLFRERSAIADTLQASLLPPVLPEVPGFDVAAEYVPGGDGVEVGGDFYDLFSTGDGRWAVVIGDVCGKGAVAATLTGVTRHTARAAAVEDDDPVHVLESVNMALLRTETGGQLRFCTAVVGVLEPGAPSVLSLARAGHPAPLVRRRSGRVEEIGDRGTLLGVYDDPELYQVAEPLRSGDLVVLYTDGVTDSWRHAGGDIRLVELLRSLPPDTPAAVAAQRIREGATRARGGIGDDMAVLVLRAL